MRSLNISDLIIIVLMVLGGGTIIKVLGIQTPFVIFSVVITFLLVLKEDFRTSEVLRLMLFVSFLVLFQLYHSVVDSNYSFRNVQFYKSILDVILAYLVVKRFQNRESSFVVNFNFIFRLIIFHAIVAVIAAKTLPTKVLFTSVDNGSSYFGPNQLLFIRHNLDSFGNIVQGDVLGLGLDRAHGLFWEPSVFVNYVAFFTFLNLFVKLNWFNVILGFVSILLSWSSTGLLLAIVLAILFLFGPEKDVRDELRARIKGWKYKIGLLIFPAIASALIVNMLSVRVDNRKLGSASQRFFDTAGAFIAISESPLLGTGVNLNSYSNALSSESSLLKLNSIASDIDLNSKEVIKYSNSFLRFMVKYGVPFGLLLFYGIWNQKIITSIPYKFPLFIIVAIGTSFSPILELTFFSPFIYSGLFLD